MGKQITNFKDAIRCVQKDGMKLFDCSDKLQNNFVVCALALHNDIQAIGAVGKDLFKNHNFFDVVIDMVVKSAVDNMCKKEYEKKQKLNQNDEETQD